MHICLQTRWRRYQALSAYKQEKKACLITQCHWRARVARKELRKLKMVTFLQPKFCLINRPYGLPHLTVELRPSGFLQSKNDINFISFVKAAKDAGALREAKDKLEKRVEELTWLLELEKHMRVFSLHLTQ